MSRHWVPRGLAAAVACCAALLGFNVANSKVGTPVRKGELPNVRMATTQDLGGADRYLTFVSTDKPIYRAGETVYVRGVLLNAARHKPLTDGQTASATIEIKGPKGDVVAGGSAAAQNSVWGFAWEVPDGQAGGEYCVRVTYPWDGLAPAERKFEFGASHTPRPNFQV